MAQSLINIPFHDVRRIGVPSREGGAVYRPGLGGWMGLGWSGYRPDWSAAQLNGWFLTGTPPQKAINHPMSVPPIDILALWELTQRTHDTDMLARFYPYAVWRFREFLESGREREDDWLFTWPPRKERADVQANRAEGRRKAEMCGMAASDSMADYAPDYSAYVLLSARLLLASAKRLDRGAEEQASFTSVMRSASAAMTKSLWSADLGLFMPRPVSNVDAIALRDPAAQGASPGIECLLPLMGGAECLTPEQDAALIKHLLDPADFWSASGVRSLSLKSPAYRPEDPDMGGIRFGIQWLFWKALLDRGDSEHAEELATRVLAAYSGASAKSDGCPEWLGAESGRAGGRLDSAGEACALLAISEAYHRAGTVSCGWNAAVLDSQYDAARDSMRLVFRPTSGEPRGVVLCAMGKSGREYRVFGDISGTFTAGPSGVIALPLPKDRTTQQVEIAPASGVK